MSYLAKRELVAMVAGRYQEASSAQKTRILDEFVAVTGYARKYAIRVLRHPVVLPVAPVSRPRARRYGPAVVAALQTAWAAANYVCAKRLVPFLPELVAALERHGHLVLTPEVREQLLTLNPATADRLLKQIRATERPRGITTTKAGTLLKHQVPVRTFTDWDDATPGFLEADLVAHCGTRAEGGYLYSLVLTDVSTGWTECLPLLHRSQAAVIAALDRVQRLLPFPLLGLDTDNGGEFLNAELIAYCAREKVTFTRGRPYKKNDQCYVEQKNGTIVRQLVGYDRFSGERAYRQLAELYRAVRLYINFFQPSMKLRVKKRTGSKVWRQYDAAQTPLQRLLASGVLDASAQGRLEAISHSLDPVRLLHQLQTLQDALWRHAVVLPLVSTPARPGTTERFKAEACGLSTPDGILADALAQISGIRRRRYRRTRKSLGPRTYRTRIDPFASVWEEVCAALAAAPERTAKSVFRELQERYPAVYSDGQLRTLQRHVQTWRARTVLEFDDQWLTSDQLGEQVLPGALRTRTDPVGVPFP